MTQILFIEGVSGAGKSTLVSRLTDRLRGQGYSVRSWLEFDFTNPIDFYCTAYFSSHEYEDLCRRYPDSVEALRQYTVSPDDVRLVRYYNEDTPLFDQPLLSELWSREFCYEPQNPVPLSEYTRVYQAVWKQYFSTLDNESDYLIFDGSLLHHPINDMMRNYHADKEQMLYHVRQLLGALGSLERKIYYLCTDDIAAQLARAHADRGQNPPSAEYVDFWRQRYQNDQFVLQSVDEEYRIFDVSHNGWNEALEMIISDSDDQPSHYDRQYPLAD